MSEIELILTKLKIVSEEKENGMYLCDKEHSKILLDYIQQKENIINELKERSLRYSKHIDNLLDIKEKVRDYIMTNLITEWTIENGGCVSGSDLPVYAITPILDILDKDII